MMNLKPYYDAVIAADAEVQLVANKINELFQAGTDEGKKSALEMRSALDVAQGKSDEAKQLYESLKKAGSQNGAALNFIPVTETQPDPEAQDKPSGKATRAEFRAMTPTARLAFAKSGGQIEE